MNCLTSFLVALALTGPPASQIIIPAENARDAKIVGAYDFSIPVPADDTETVEVKGPGWLTSQDVGILDTGKGTIGVWGAPGEHWIRYDRSWAHFRERSIKDGDGNIQTFKEFLGWGEIDTRCDFTILGAVDPGPDPPIPPDPQPGPGGPWKVWFLENPEQRDNLPREQANLLTSLKYREDLKYLGHEFQQIVSNNVLSNPPARLEEVAQASSGKPLPGLVIESLDGGEYRWFPLPANYTELAKLLDEVE